MFTINETETAWQLLFICSAGADEKLIDQLSDEAREKFAMATSLFSNILNQVVTGTIAIKLLNHILQKRSTFFELLNLGKTPHMWDFTLLPYNNVRSHYLLFLQTVFVRMKNTRTPLPWGDFFSLDKRRWKLLIMSEHWWMLLLQWAAICKSMWWV